MAALTTFERIASEIKNKYLYQHVEMLIKDLNSFNKIYLRKHKLTSNNSIV